MANPSPDGTPSASSRLAPLTLLAVTLAVSVVSLWNGFAGDDVYIIAQNSRVHDLAPAWQYLRQSYWPSEFGGGLYRPLTVLGFALQWKLGGGIAAAFHAVNVLLYAATTMAVWLLARRLLTAGAAWLVAAFFAVHPVHVEAVANVVGQPEILVTGLHLTAVIWYLSARRRGALTYGVILGIAAIYLVSCLAKENAVVLPGLLLLAELVLVPSREPPAPRLKALLPFFGILVVVGLGYIAARGAVVGGLVGEYPHPAIRNASIGGRALTMLEVVPQWWRLLLVPWHLQSDYMPLELNRGTGFGGPQAMGALFVLAWGWAAWRARRTYPVATFGLAWVAVTLFPVSNLLVPTGILLAERTLFSPSAGACLAIGGVAPWIAARVSAAPLWERQVAGGFAAALLLLWGSRSAARATVWRADPILARQTVVDAPLSYRAHATMGKILFAEGNPEAGEREYRIALKLYPHDPNVFAGLGQHYRNAGLYRPAIPLFRKALELAPQMNGVRNMLIYCLAQSGDSAGAAAELAEKLARHEADADRIAVMLDSLYRSRGTGPSTAR
jgi:hypothetical protein